MFGRVLKENNIGNMDSDKPIYSSGHDLTPNQEKLEQIRDGWISSAYSQNPYDQGYQAVKMLVDFYKTGDPASFKVLDTGVKCIDRTNVDEYFQMLEDGKPVG
jgi:ABC-type sugar transport system substrate-binding protein